MTDSLTIHFSSAKADWGTPTSVFDPLHEEFDFVLDVCATPNNTKCANYYSLFNGENGLALQWWPSRRCWMNPPYGRSIGVWVKKAWQEAGFGALVVCLLPARTDTNWWAIFWDHEKHRMRHEKDEVRFIKGRVKFIGAKASAPFPSAIVVMRPRNAS